MMNNKKGTGFGLWLGGVGMGLLLASCAGGGGGVGPGDPLVETPSGQGAQSMKPSVVSATSVGAGTLWTDSAVDASGNLYSVGYLQDDTGEGMTFDLGNSVKVTTTAGFRTPVVLKRNASGVVQSAKALPNACTLNAVVVDGQGNLFVAGSVSRRTDVTIDFGGGVTLAGPGWQDDYSIQYTFLAKIDTLGTVLWAEASLAGGGTSGQNAFVDVDVDSTGNAYAAGYISGTGVAGLINGDVIDGTNSRGSFVVVKYGNDGTALWGRAPSSGSGYSNFKAIRTTADGELYAIAAYGDGACRFSPDVSAPQTILQETNQALVKFSSAGIPLWAQTLSPFDAGTDTTWAKATYTGLDRDGAGNVFVSGYFADDVTYQLGNGVQLKGRSRDSQETMALILYASDGKAQWASTVQTGTSRSQAWGVTADGKGNAYVYGFMTSIDTLGWGNGVSARGSASYQDNPLLVKFNSSGVAQWAKTQVTGSSGGTYQKVHLLPSGAMAALGSLNSGDHGFGDNMTINAVDTGALVTYQE